MKNHLYASILASALAVPAFAADTQYAAQSPAEPLHRRTVLLGVAIVLGLQALRHAPRLPDRRAYQPGE
ncbi:hypothetical protein KW842_21920 [Duganella sp. sic0402]|uniref:hypothetical protein n=1 Tax=Duganella sp. sic0402 TaxID=2854786 RepID=UPI001C43D1C5|nr:hypothetical protein [Duganella sp. sic0402]MBV7538437.1 hypothetical protein [Duganella sp. sic0402]